jgi:hypothetical protein
MNKEHTRANLLAALHTQHSDLETLIGGLDSHTLTLSGVEGEWSIKDILHHLVYWQGVAIEALRLHTGGEIPPAAIWGDVDQRNARVILEGRAKSLDRARAELQQSQAAITALLEKLDDTAVQSVFPWTDNVILWEFIGIETFYHYREHIDKIRSWLQARS